MSFLNSNFENFQWIFYCEILLSLVLAKWIRTTGSCSNFQIWKQALYFAHFVNVVSRHDYQFSSVQLLSHVQLFVTPWTAARRASLSITKNSRSLIKLVSIESVMPSSHLILCCPLLLPPSIFSSIRIFSYESILCISWPNYWASTSASILSNEDSGLISFRMVWLDLLAVQGTFIIILHMY